MRLQKILLGVVMTAMVTIIPSVAYGQAYGTVATGTLNVREKATTDSRILQQVGLGVPVEIVTESNDWLRLTLKDGSTAYVKSEFITVHRVVATVEVAGGLNVRDYPSTDKGAIIGKFYHGDEISVHYKVDDWYKISQEGFEGFVHKDFVKEDLLRYLPIRQLSEVQKVTISQQQVNMAVRTPSTKTATSAKSSSLGDSIVSYAKQFLGNPYVYGGSSLTRGTDCSGFTQQIMRNFGVSIQRSSSMQYANNGYAVNANNLQKGDLLFYGYKGRVSHVGIYIGGGQIIHANDERTGIIISSAFSSGSKPFIGAKRVI
ncbi:C40 family peptidase [Cellulosilyticum sp. I15G10I2]|uniref:C40 family peptidase n=1 Tax=Cellulosilyticum sp. I15G10I2 TaxID=1892843 RepID=UPI00085CC432|nr:C40 family peptidase [Cellulosilyticum sp. I15G10I2]